MRTELSRRLKDTRNKFSACRHGGLTLTGDNLEALVSVMDQCVALAVAMEEAMTAMQPLPGCAITRLTTPASAAILHSMRPGSNVVPFSPPDRRS
jgi:hypothetical protein